MTDSVNDTLTHAEQIFKDLVWNALVKAALARAILYAPFLGWPVIGPIVSIVVGIFADKLFKELQLGLDLTYIKFQDEEAEKAFHLSSMKLSVEAAAHGVDSPQYKEANEKLKADFAKFVSFAS